MSRNRPFRFTGPLTVGDLKQVLDRWVANHQGANAKVVIECFGDADGVYGGYEIVSTGLSNDDQGRVLWLNAFAEKTR